MIISCYLLNFIYYFAKVFFLNFVSAKHQFCERYILETLLFSYVFSNISRIFLTSYSHSISSQFTKYVYLYFTPSYMILLLIISLLLQHVDSFDVPSFIFDLLSHSMKNVPTFNIFFLIPPYHRTEHINAERQTTACK